MVAAAATACALTLLLALPAAGTTAGAAAPASWPSASGAYRLGYHSQLQPIAINRIHSWILHLETASGTPVSNAQMSVTGGMPAHDHGLPTRPRVTGQSEAGDYLLEGVRFHMSGYWEIVVELHVDGRRDTVTIPLEL